MVGGFDMEYFDDNIETSINNEYDYSNMIVTVQSVDFVARLCDHFYNYFLSLVESDEAKNEKLKYEFQNYEYKKSYLDSFKIMIQNKSYNSIYCKSYDSFVDAVNKGQVKNVNCLEIELNLSYQRGTTSKFVNHENVFNITFKPYNIVFTRKSNFKEVNMDKVETSINELLEQIPVVDTIFFSK